MNLNKEWYFVLSALALGILAVWVPLMVDPRFFYLDDKQTFVVPYATDIAGSLLNGELPFLSLSTVFGGNYAIDWQHGLLNPYSLLTYLINYAVNDLQLAGALLVGAYLPLLTLGTYLLARSYRLERGPALLFAGVISSNNFLLYWAGGSWHNHLVGTVWFVWSWVFLQGCQEQGRYAVVGFTASAYLLLTCGFPQAAIVLALLTAIYLIRTLRMRDWRPLLDMTVGSLVAILLATPSLLPTVFTLSVTTRETGISNHSFLTPTLGDYLQLGAPAFFPKIQYWNSDMHVPIFYLAWFIPPLAILVDQSGARRVLGRMAPVIVMLVILLLFGTGPENLGPLRWPFRFLPFIHISAGLIFFAVLFQTGPLILTIERLAMAMGLMALAIVVAVMEEPGTWRVNWFAGLGMAGLFTGSIMLYRWRGCSALLWGLFAGTVAIFVATHVVISRNNDVPDFQVTGMRTGSEPPSMQVFSGYALYLGDRLSHHSVGGVAEFSAAATGILDGTYTFNGYTPLGHKALQQELCIAERTQTLCAAGVAKWLEPDALTQAPLLDLFRIKTVVAQYGMWREGIAAYLGPGWRSLGRGETVEKFERVVPLTLPGTLAWHPQKVRVDAPEPMRHQAESLSVLENAVGGRLIFARLFWPGYHASFNGKPLEVVAHRGFLVAVDLPPETTGRLDLWFRPPGLRLGFALAGLGLMLMLVYLLVREHQTKRMNDLGQL